MDSRQIIQQSIDYIEKNLKTEITAQELASKAGFSVYHFYRLFQSAVGIPVMQFVTRRKLLNAIYEIGQGEKITNAALLYGFDTQAGFYKAFRREFGYAPSEFLKKFKAKQPYPICLTKEEHLMVSHKKITEILKNWGMQDQTVQDIYYMGTGNHNENAFYVGDSYVIKFTPVLGKLKSHIALSQAMEEAGLCAATAVRTLEGTLYCEDGELYYCLTKRIRGNQLVAAGLFQDPHTGRFIGEIIGQLHGALNTLEVEVPEEDLFQTVMEWALPASKKVLDLPEQIYEDYSQTFGRLVGRLPRQIIHRDPNPGNLILDNGKWGFIDFDLSQKNIRLFDPCYAATAVLSECFTDRWDPFEKWIPIYQNILYGYDHVAKLSEEEKKATPYVVLSNQFICTACFSGQGKYKELLKANAGMTKWIAENLNKLQL